VTLAVDVPSWPGGSAPQAPRSFPLSGLPGVDTERRRHAHSLAFALFLASIFTRGVSSIFACVVSSILACGVSPILACGVSLIVTRETSPTFARGVSPICVLVLPSPFACGVSSILACGVSPILACGVLSIVACGVLSILACGVSSILARGVSPILARGVSPILARGVSPILARGVSPILAADALPLAPKTHHAAPVLGLRIGGPGVLRAVVSSIFARSFKEKGRTWRSGLTRVVTCAALGVLSSRALSSAQANPEYPPPPTTNRLPQPSEMSMTNAAARDAVIAQYCRELKLPAVHREHPALARQAQDGGWPYEDYLVQLLDAEVTSRRDAAAARLLKQARFPDVKTLDQIDWEALRGVSRPKVMELASCAFADKAEDVVIAGPIGTGKTHLAVAVGVEATRRRMRVHFARAADLVRSLLEARDERTLGALLRRLQRVQILVVDELGFVPFSKDGGELLFNLLAERYERRSTIVTTNLAFSEWVQVFGSEKLTAALLDRLAHHSHILTTRGDSYRFSHRRSKSTDSPVVEAKPSARTPQRPTPKPTKKRKSA